METKPLVTVLWPAMWARINAPNNHMHREAWPSSTGCLYDMGWKCLNKETTFIELIHHEKRINNNGLFD